MSIVNAAISAMAEVLLLAGVPFLLYWAYQSSRHKRSLGEAAKRAGLQLGEKRYLVYSVACAVAGVVALVV